MTNVLPIGTRVLVTRASYIHTDNVRITGTIAEHDNMPMPITISGVKHRHVVRVDDDLVDTEEKRRLIGSLTPCGDGWYLYAVHVVFCHRPEPELSTFPEHVWFREADPKASLSDWLYIPAANWWVCFEFERFRQPTDGELDGSVGGSDYHGFEEGLAKLIEEYGVLDDGQTQVEAPKRPFVTLGETGKRYASELSTLQGLDPALQADLAAAGLGLQVDAFDLGRAATAAISLVLGKRYWKLSQREGFARKARHLIYRTDAVVENHLDQLPAYAEGERSRKIEALESERDELRAELTKLSDEVASTVRDAKTELEAAVERANQAETVVSNVVEQYNRLSKTAGESDALLAETVRERDALKAALAFAYREFDDEVGRVLDAFTIGHREGSQR